MADDVNDVYLKFAKESLHKVSAFRTQGGGIAAFPSKAEAEASINRSGYSGTAIVLPVKRNENLIILSPSEAIKRGIWEGDNDKRITLHPDVGAELVEKIGKAARRGEKISVPWQFENTYDSRKRLAGMGIETPAELRAALREFIGLRTAPKEVSKIKEMERTMIGRSNDGMDFFPTPESTADAMVEAADIKEGMSVLEPSAGMGHIAERIREAGVEPDVVEMASDRRELLEAKGFYLVGSDFMGIKPRESYTYGDTFEAPDGKIGRMAGHPGGSASGRVVLRDDNKESLGFYNRDELKPIQHNGVDSGYDRILMNPPFSDRRDALHVQHAYSLLKPGGRLVAIMGEGVFFGSDKKATEFRGWLESIGGTSEKLESGTFNDSSLPVNTGVNARMVVIEKADQGTALFSRSDNSDAEFAHDFLANLADVDELFRYPVSNKTSLEGVFSDVYPEAEYIGDGTRADERDASGADHRFVFKSPQGKQFYVYERDNGEAFIDVSNFSTGEFGQSVYAAVANYTYNTNKKFIADPAGLTADSLIRRTSNMLSSALRYGTTQNIEPALQQLAGDPKNGVEPLVWRGDDVAKTRALIHTFITTLHNQFPQLKDYKYDFSSRQFVDRQGRPVGADRFADAGRLGVARSSRAGEATMRRGILIQSLISSESGQRPGILEQALNGGRSLVLGGDLSGLFSRQQPSQTVVNPHTRSTLTAAIDQAFPKTKEFARLLLATGKFHIIEAKDIPVDVSEAEYSKDGHHILAYHQNGQTYFVADVEAKFAALVEALNESPMTARASIIDKGKADGYWSRIIERAARSFENYVIAKMAEKGYHNDYLANVVDIAEFKRDAGRYPYLKTEEIAPVVEAFDNLFGELKTKETDKGVAIYSSANLVPESEQLSAAKLLDVAEQAVGQLGHKPSIVIVDSLSHITGRADDAGRASGMVKGGKIYLFRDGIAGGHEAVRTIWHELLHYGIRRFLTADEYIKTMRDLAMRDAFIRKNAQAWAKSPDAEKARSYAKSKDELKDRADAYVFARGVDEALANFSEAIGANGSAYAKNDALHVTLRSVRKWLANLADKIGMKSVGDWIRGKDNEAARNYVQNVLGKLRNDDQATSGDWAFTADGAYMATTAESLPGIEAAPPAIPPRQGGLGLEGGATGSRASWDSPEPSKIDDLLYKLQNKNIDLKRVIAAVKESGAAIADKYNAYLQEELYHGRSAKRTLDFVNGELKPLLSELAMRGLTIPELEQYLHARHAEEANKLIAERNPGNPEMQDGGSGMKTQEAKDYLATLPAEKRRKLESAAARVDAILNKTRNLYVSYGLVSRDQANSWAEMFRNYIPLMREDHDGAMGVGQGFSVKGKEVKHRTGSTRKVVDILANIALQREKAIVRGEKNRVAVALAGLVKLNPNPDFWSFDKVPTERVLNEQTGLVEERSDPTFRSRNNVIIAKIKDGSGEIHERAVVFNEGNPRALRMSEALKNLDAPQMEGLLGVSAKITRYFAAINTQYNPIFGVVNLVRDFQGSLINLSSTPIAGHQKEMASHIIPALIGVYSATRAATKGNETKSVWADLWEEMQNEGGMTGYRDLYRDSDDRAKAIKHALDPHAWHDSKLGKIFTANGTLKVPLAVAQDKAAWIFDWLSDYNQTMEGATRLSVYKTALDNGMNKAQAASLAKNISVNFNRKGQAGQQAGALYAFFNAAMQGTARIGETLTTMDKGNIKTFRLSSFGTKAIAGGVMLGSMQAMLLLAAGFDDDEPPEFIRERNLILPIGDRKYLTVPMPLGFHAVPNIGRIPTEFVMGGFKNPGDHILRLVGVFAEAFNPLGSSGVSIQTIAPTAIDPLVALSENKDWTGKPIARENFNKLSPSPGFTRNKDTASDPSKWLSEAINTLSGGTKYTPGAMSPTADQIDYLFGQVTGGVGRESSKLEQSIMALVTGEDLPPHKIPLLGRFYGDSGAQSSQGNKFYTNLKRINEVEAELKGRRKDGLPVEEYKNDNPEYKLVTRANITERMVGQMRTRKRELVKKNAPPEQIKAAEARITTLMTGLNERVKELRQEPAH
ncbi:MAG: hypothetical protein NTW90_06770 [Nitrosospira sp.]|nr:hypothetical protein [Nitrosospira sp.]